MDSKVKILRHKFKLGLRSTKPARIFREVNETISDRLVENWLNHFKN